MHLLLAHLALMASGGSGCDAWQELPNSVFQTSKGPLVVEQTSDGSGYDIRLAGKKINGLDTYWASASLSDLLRVGTHELIVIELYSGGAACPAEYVVLDVSASPHLSETFGTCNPAVRLAPGEGSLTISMPAYFADPNVLSASERREIAARVDTFIWANGKVQQVGNAP